MRSSLAWLTLAAAFAAHAASAAQSVSVDHGVTVVRGSSGTEAAEERRSTREGGGVTVFRGRSEPFPPDLAPPAPEPQQVIRSGDVLWIYNQQTGEVVACDLRTTVYGERAVRCTSN